MRQEKKSKHHKFEIFKFELLTINNNEDYKNKNNNNFIYLKRNTKFLLYIFIYL